MEKYSLIINIFIFIIVVCILIGVALLLLAQLSPSDICESLCNYKNGTYWLATDCEGDVMACSGFCVIGNETLNCSKLLDEINSSI